MANHTASLAPVGRKGHFVYGVLDLLQFHACAMLSGKHDKHVIDLMLQVVQVSQYSFLRCKAFEVLAKFSTKHGVGQLPIKSTNDILECRDLWQNERTREKVFEQWRVMKTKVLVEEDHHLTRLKQKLPERTLVNDFNEPVVSVHSILMGWKADFKGKELEFEIRQQELKQRCVRMRDERDFLGSQLAMTKRDAENMQKHVLHLQAENMRLQDHISLESAAVQALKFKYGQAVEKIRSSLTELEA
jgi:hypothetical protein